jgi:hypothetical protein
MSQELEKRERRSAQFAEGYSECLRRWEVAEASTPPYENAMDWRNPYDADTEQSRGFEEAYYDLTQK